MFIITIVFDIISISVVVRGTVGIVVVPNAMVCIVNSVVVIVVVVLLLVFAILRLLLLAGLVSHCCW